MARPVADNNAPLPSPTHGVAQEDGNDKHKYLVVAALACCGILFAAFVMQANGTINVYVDYTDALFALGAVASLAILKTNTAKEKVFATALFVVLAFFPSKSAFTHNNSIWAAIFSLLAKFVAVGVLVIGVASLLSRPTSTTRKSNE